MSSSLARKMRRQNLVRATARDDVVLQTAQRVQQLEGVVGVICQLLEQHGIRLEQKTESGIIVPKGPLK